MRKRIRTRRHGVTFLELTISSLLVGVLLVAALRGLGASARTGLITQHRAQAELLANEVQTELSALAYSDPDEASLFGPEPSESAVTTRAGFDDVDDFDGWVETPPQDRNGQLIPAVSSWQRQISVAYVDPLDLSSVVATDLGTKRVTVTVLRQSPALALATAVAYHTSSWPHLLADVERNQTTGKQPNGNQRPIARIVAEPIHGGTPLTVNFDGTASSDPEGTSLSYAWDFGDGNVSTLATPTHSFVNLSSLDEAFQVKLTVTDPSGALAVTYKTIIVFVD